MCVAARIRIATWIGRWRSAAKIAICARMCLRSWPAMPRWQGCSRLAEAEAWAREALEGAEAATVRRYTLWALAWPVALSGRPVDELCARSRVAEDPAAYISAAPERVAAKRLFWRGELARARALLEALVELADERGDLTSYAMVRMHIVEVDLRAGNFDAAERLLDEWGQSSDFETQFRPQYPRCRALLEAGRGAQENAKRWGHQTIDLAQATGSAWDELEARRALGIAALIEPAPEQALAELSPVWEHCEREGVLDPGAFPVAPELVEALVELEQFGDARVVVGRLKEMAADQDHPWARVTAKRGGSADRARRQWLRGAERGNAAGGVGGARRARVAIRQRPLPARARPRAAPSQAVAWGARDARARGRRVRGPRRRGMGATSAVRARAGRRAPPGDRGADAQRAARSRARGGRAVEQGDRRGALRRGEHGRGPSCAARTRSSACAPERNSASGWPRARNARAAAPKESGFRLFQCRRRGRSLRPCANSIHHSSRSDSPVRRCSPHSADPPGQWG